MIPLRAALIVAAGIGSAMLARAQAPDPYAIVTFGEFREMAMQRDYAAKTTLAAALADGASDGVGALADARGEITIVDGVPVITYGGAAEHPPAAEENAMLLTTAIVRAWQEIPVGRDVPPGDLEPFLAKQAKTHGFDPEGSFPFRLHGTVTAYVLHVTSGPGSGHPPLTQETRKGDAVDGLVVGLYVAPQLVGIATHPGERTHSHWVSENRRQTAHLDAWGIRSGAVLLLPKRIGGRAGPNRP